MNCILDLSGHRIWKDKHINPEGKEIYAYLYTNGFGKTISHMNIGDIQHVLRIRNKGLKNNLEKLQDNNYIKFNEYDTGMYEYYIC